MKFLPKLFSALLFPIILFVLNLVFMAFDLYQKHTDSVFHLIGGVVVAQAMWVVLSEFISKKRLPDPFIRRLFVFTLVATIAVFWEFGEFLAEYFFHLHLQDGVDDTMKDLALGMSGAMLYVVWKKYHSE